MKRHISKLFASFFTILTGLFAGFTKVYASVGIDKDIAAFTGDNSHSQLALWILLGAGAIIVVCAIFMFAKKKK